MKQTLAILLIAITALSLAGCMTSQQEAEQAAKDFVEKRAVFFTKSEGNATVVKNFSLHEIRSWKDGSDWAVEIRIESPSPEKAKTADIKVKVDKNGKVTELNGMPVTE
ncbi:hypothetical protein HY640_03345 [Candidatus Woesearchaeota archaeon]|nr:hypothetical protein [Candidatus Woesearchaeota archaeon]